MIPGFCARNYTDYTPHLITTGDDLDGLDRDLSQACTILIFAGTPYIEPLHRLSSDNIETELGVLARIANLRNNDLQIDHLQIDQKDPTLQLHDVVQDLYSVDPTQETCPILDDVGYTAPTRQHDPDHTRSGV